MQRITRPFLVAMTLLFPVFFPDAQVRAQVQDSSGIVAIELLTGWRKESGTHMAALRVTLAPGWKTYWRAGGQTGLPPKFNWQGSRNLGEVRYRWPRPEILDAVEGQIIGFQNEMVLPIEITPQTDGADIVARLELEIGVCKDICMLVTSRLAADLNTREQADRFLIELALADPVISAEQAGLRSVGCVLTPIRDGVRIEAEFILPTHSTKPEAVVLETAQTDGWLSPVTTSRQGDRLRAEASLVSLSGEPLAVDLDELRFTLIDQDRAIDIRGCPLQRS